MCKMYTFTRAIHTKTKHGLSNYMKFASSLVNSAFSKAICFSHISMKQNCHSHKGLHTLHVCLFFFSHVNTNFHSHCIRHYQWLMRRDANELPNTRSCSCLSTWGLALSVLQFNLFMKHPVLKQCYLLRCNIYVYFKMWWNRISVGN